MLARLRRYDVVAEEVDQGISAFGKKERPAWERVLDMVDRGQVDVIVAWHIDRVTRNLMDLERLIILAEDKSVAIATVTGDTDLSTDTGRMTSRIVAAVARAEVERKGARQKRANLARRQAGQMWGSGWRSFGYTLEGEVVADEALLIQESAESLLAGASLRDIARRWQASGLSTPRNAKGASGWTHQGVKAVLLNPKLAGYMTYKGEITGDGAWEPILDRATFALIQAKLTERRATGGTGKGRGKSPANLLSSIAVCGECGKPVQGRTMSKQTGPRGARVTVGRTEIYSCGGGAHLSIARDEADELVIHAFAQAARWHRPGMVLSIPGPGATVQLHAEAEVCREQLDDLASSYARGAITLSMLEAATAEINEKLTELENAIRSAEPTDYDPRKLNHEAITNFYNLDLSGKRAILARLARIKLLSRQKRRGIPTSRLIDMDVKVTAPDGTVSWIPMLRQDPEPVIEAARAQRTTQGRLWRPSEIPPVNTSLVPLEGDIDA